MHENLNHTVIKHLTKKTRKYSHFQTVTAKNSKHFFKFNIKQYWQFQGVTTEWYYTLFHSSYQTILTLSECYYQTRVNTFWEFISNITDTFRELLSNNTTHFSRDKTVLTFSEYYWEVIQIFPHFISLSNNTDIFRVTGKQCYTSRVYIKQYWHFQRVPSKLNYSKNFFQSSYYTILTLSEGYCQTTLTYSELISNSIDTFTELLSNNSKHFFGSLSGHLNRQNSQMGNYQVKVRKVSIHTWSR